METIADFLWKHREVIKLLFDFTLVLSMVLAPWLVGRWRRKHDLPPISRLRRVLGCLSLSMMSVFILWLPGIGWGLLPCCVGLIPLACVYALIEKPKFFPRGPALLVLMLCNLTSFAFVWVGSEWNRQLEYHAWDESRLRDVAFGMSVYVEQHQVYPDDLRRLVDESTLGPAGLIPVSQYRHHLPTTLPYTGPCELRYNLLPPEAPPGLVWIWFPPSVYRDEGATVLYSDRTHSRAEWVQRNQFEKDLARTQEWMTSHPYPTTAATASRPATGAAKER